MSFLLIVKQWDVESRHEMQFFISLVSINENGGNNIKYDYSDKAKVGRGTVEYFSILV